MGVFRTLLLIDQVEAAVYLLEKLKALRENQAQYVVKVKLMSNKSEHFIRECLPRGYS